MALGDPTFDPTGDPTTAAQPTPQQPGQSAAAAQSAAQPAAQPYTVSDKIRSGIAAALGAGYDPKSVTDYLANDTGGLGDSVRRALAVGYTPAAIIDHLNPNVSEGSWQGTAVLAPVQRGIAQAQHGVAGLADDLGFSGLAKDIRSRINQQALETPTAGSDMSAQLKAGHVGAALADIPSAVLEQALPSAAALATGALTGGAGSAVALAARLGGGAAIGAASQGDALARQRAANNNETQPSASDVALGVLGGAATGAAGSLGLGGVGQGLGGVVGRTIAHAAGDAAQPELASLAGSTGTTAGAQNASPSDMAAAALTGAATRVGMAAPDALAATAQLTPAARSAASAAQWNDMTPDAQRFATNAVAAHDALTQAGQSAVGQSAVPLAKAAATARDGIAGKVGALATGLRDQGLLDNDGLGTINDALSAARSPGKVLTTDHLDAIAGLGLSSDDTNRLQDAVSQVNLLSSPDALQSRVGPIRSALDSLPGQHVGGAIGSMIGGALAGWHGGALGYAIGSGSRALTRATMGGAADAIDAALGYGGTPLARQAADAQSMMAAAGVQVPNMMADLTTAIGTQRDALSQQRALMGLQSQLATAAQARADAQAAFNTAAQRDQAGLDKASAAAAALKSKQMDAMAAQQQSDMKLAAQRQAEIEAAYTGQAPDYEAAFADMEARQSAGQQQGQAAVAANTRSQVAGYLADQQAAAAQARAAGVTSGAVANGLETAQGLATGASGPRPVGDSGKAPQVLPAASQGVPGATATASPPPPAGPLSPSTAGLSAAALAQAQRLPAWVYGIGAGLQDALGAAGRPRDVAMYPEVMQAVSRLQAKGMLPDDISGALRGHQGRVVPLLYGLIRNEALGHNGIDRTVGGYQAAPVSAGNNVSPMRVAAE